MQHSRRHDPYPFTWEIPVGLSVGVALLLVLGAHAGRAAANLLTGAGWGFPPRTELFTSLPDLLAGDATAGLRGLDNSAVPDAAPWLLWACVAATELALLIVMAVAVKAGLDRWGPSRVHGTASRTEAERLLGRARLRQHRAIIRPDLYAGNHRGRADGDRT